MHRDIKLPNILTKDGQVKLADFSLSCSLTPGESLCQTAGTPGYMAPEIVNGHPYDHKADIFSLGTCFYGLLSGTMPFASRGMVDSCVCV